MKDNESRTAFSKDTDRIIHSMSYARYIDKTQVYSFIRNDHITHRVLHVQDIMINSYNKGYLSFSKEVYNALLSLKKWNYQNIYKSKEACKNKEIIEEYFYKLYYKYLSYLEENNDDNNKSKERLFKFINSRSKDYKANTSVKRMIIDYISGQTDHYFLNECEYNFKEFNKEKLYQ